MMTLSLATLSAQAQSARPPAGTPIGNQAAATYTDGTGQNKTATSNVVTTIVQQVASLDLVDNRFQQGAPGGPVYLPHTVTNTGNGPDSYTLDAVNLSGDNYDLDGNPTTSGTQQPVIYADANGDGQPDNFTPITVTPTLAAGQSFSFVVAGYVPSTGTTAGDVARVDVTATSNFDNTQSDENTDTVTVSENAIIRVTKAISDNTGLSPSGPYTYTLTYSNIGRGAATNVRIVDDLDPRLDYVETSGRWSNTGSAVLTDTTGDNQSGIDYSVNQTTETITAVIGSVPAGASGTLSFQVDVRSNVAPGVIPNTATFQYNNGAANVDPTPTNTVNLTITPTAGVTGTSPPAKTNVPQGSTQTFNNVFTNTGTGVDSFDITLESNSYPSGTGFLLFKSDGVTPLVDTNGNQTPDTGPVNPGASYTVVLQISLPANTSSTPQGGYSITKRATSFNDPTKTATTTDTITTIQATTVDLTNTNIGGTGPGPEASPVLTLTGSPGETARFPLSATNNGSSPDNYDITVVSPTNLPPGFSVVFRDTNGGVITNTGNVPAGQTVNFFADVTIPEGASPGDIELFFRILSPNTGAQDTIRDRLTVQTERDIEIVPDNAGQTFAGSTIVYSHVVTNNGNVQEDIDLTVTNSRPGFTTQIFSDDNDNGILDPTDTQIINLQDVDPGESRTIFVKVFAPANATPGLQDVATVTASATGGTNPPSDSAIDTTTIVAGQLQIVKEQALDVDNNGVIEGSYTTANITEGAVPGAGIRYRITVTNIGTAPVSSVIVSDSTPVFTTYEVADNTQDDTGRATFTTDGGTNYTDASAPSDEGTGTLTFNVGTLNPGQSATLYFGVQIARPTAPS